MEEKPVSGIIYPPPELRGIIDKTAAFVAKNGKEFEARIKTNEQNNPRFKFLEIDSPYNAYYEMKIDQAKREMVEYEQKALAQGFAMNAERDGTPGAASREATPITEDAAEPVTAPQPRPIPKENPCAPVYSVPIPEDITPLDLDIIKLTAQYVARNGQSFLSNITGREHRNMQFDFLKGTHRWFQFFRGLVDAYTKILMPPKDVIEKLREDLRDKARILDRCQQAADWTTAQEKEKKETEEALEAERVAFQLIDWHDFVVVETIDFKDDLDELPTAPPPVAMTLPAVDPAAHRQQPHHEEHAMDEDDVQGRGPPPRPKEGVIAPEDGDEDIEARVKRDYTKQPQQREKQPVLVVDPQSGQLVEANMASEHMRIKTLDPKWKEQQKREREKQLSTNIAPDADMGRALNSFAKRRTDIFGDVEVGLGEEATVKPASEKRRPEDTYWDGQASSIPKTANAALQFAPKAGDPPQMQAPAIGPGAAPFPPGALPAVAMQPPSKRPRTE